ncbi:hypothetical protein KUL42_32960 [Alteromonas sp. KUL42]|uniref:Panacea domain-containing protein n=1 Tax=Alteromonas sp. KUL42 TaxID=2480797 RepID=UPI001035E4D7|nr:type II toxin-antitoxin system antitoxin SocA domain-containing protein [Alteromonas sp. KUL42]TAP33309.1 DUF4065 domain-containing protein [Alteromonas sp. KUL42]GEA08535.1 hypothetical protein KUL42_32960 [Alteromonas sp. KUL42]
MIESGIFSEILVAQAAQKGIKVCPMKLQKLAYYCHGYHLSVTGEPLVAGEFQAWPYGPVHPDIYQQYKQFGNSAIPAPTEWRMPPNISETIIGIINFVLEEFGRLGAWTLSQKTHKESPWLAHYDSTTQTVDGRFIAESSISCYFTGELVNAQDKELAMIMDSAEETNVVSMPPSISSAEDFSNWIDNIEV